MRKLKWLLCVASVCCVALWGHAASAQPPMFAGGGSWSGTIDADATLSVPSQYATVQDALDYLADKYIAQSATVTISVAPGTYTYTEPIYSRHPCLSRVQIVGDATYGKTLSGIVSSSGSSGNWSLVLQLDDISGIAVDEYVLISSPSGGTNPTYIAGVFKVTAVDAGNNRITIASKHKASSAPSGSVAASVTVLNTILKFSGCNGIQVDCQYLGMVDKVAIVGDGTSDKVGLYSMFGGGAIQCGTTLGVTGWDIGARAANGNKVHTGQNNAFSGNSIGLYEIHNGTITADHLIVSGNANYGVMLLGGGCLIGESSMITGNGTGVYAACNATARIGLSTITGNTTGLNAYGQSYMHVYGCSYANNGTNTTPAINTEGNKGALIDDGT